MEREHKLGVSGHNAELSEIVPSMLIPVIGFAIALEVSGVNVTDHLYNRDVCANCYYYCNHLHDSNGENISQSESQNCVTKCCWNYRGLSALHSSYCGLISVIASAVLAILIVSRRQIDYINDEEKRVIIELLASTMLFGLVSAVLFAITTSTWDYHLLRFSFILCSTLLLLSIVFLYATLSVSYMIAFKTSKPSMILKLASFVLLPCAATWIHLDVTEITGLKTDWLMLLSVVLVIFVTSIDGLKVHWPIKCIHKATRDRSWLEWSMILGVIYTVSVCLVLAISFRPDPIIDYKMNIFEAIAIYMGVSMVVGTLMSGINAIERDKANSEMNDQ